MGFYNKKTCLNCSGLYSFQKLLFTYFSHINYRNVTMTEETQIIAQLLTNPTDENGDWTGEHIEYNQFKAHGAKVSNNCVWVKLLMKS